MELRKQGLDPLKDEIVMKAVTPRKEVKKVEEPKVETTATSTDVPKAETEEVANVKAATPETEQEEFSRLKAEKAWVNSDKKARYNELKAKFSQ